MFIFQVERYLIRQELARLLKEASYDTVLDIGSGTTNERYKDLVKAKKYFCVDHDPKVKPDIIASADDLKGISDGLADLIIMTDLLFCVAEPLKVLQEAYRVLKPGGRLVFSANFLTCECLEVGGDKLRFSQAQADWLAAQAGFTRESSRKIGGYFTVKHQLSVKFLNELLSLYQRNIWGRVFSKLFLITGLLAVKLDKVFQKQMWKFYFATVIAVKKSL